MKIRQATISDASSIYELNKECLPIYFSLLEHISLILAPFFLVIVAERNNGEIIGYMIGQYETDNFHIYSIGVSNKYRRKGIGKMLIDYLVTNHNNDYKSITLNVHDLNESGINFYKKNGFQIEKTLKNYYDGNLKSTSQNALFMRKIVKV